MSSLLYIDSSSLGEASVSCQIAQSFLGQWEGEVIHRALAAPPVPLHEASRTAAENQERRLATTAGTPRAT